MGAYSGPELVDDGLVLALDAANTRSYGGSGTTWTDVSYNGNNGTLTNGPVFTQEPSLEPFGGAGAVSFDGSGDYLTITNSTDHNPGTGDFTIEGWFKTSATVSYQTIISKYGAPTNYNGWYISLDSAGTGFYFSVFDGSSTQVTLTGGSNLNNGAWHHFAASRSGTSLKLFIDGTSVATATNSFNITSTADLRISGYPTVSRDWNGQLSNIRIVKGTALYTSNFTPKRQPLIPESAPNTVLLTCQKGNIRDRSPSAHTIIINGDAKSISGASYFDFDGTNDRVIVPSNNEFAFGTGDFTIECWFNSDDISITTQRGLFQTSDTAGGLKTTYTTGVLIAQSTSGEGSLRANVLGTYFGSTSGAITTNQWYHVALTRASGVCRLFLDGSLLDSATISGNITGTNLCVGGYYSTAFLLDGKISNLRIYKGKGLTAAEVLQNYQNTKSRYGL